MSIQWLTTDQVARNGVKVLGYGMAGTGKTTLIATAPNPFVISAESGLLSLRKHSIAGAAINSLEDLNQMIRWAREAKEAQQFATICGDSVSEIAEVCLAGLLKKSQDPRKVYPELEGLVISALRELRDLPGKHVYLTCKEEWQKDEATGAFRYQPMLPGRKLSQQLPYLFDEVFRACVIRAQDGKKYHVLQTQADYQFEAKDRSGCLYSIEQPNLTAIINKITGGK